MKKWSPVIAVAVTAVVCVVIFGVLFQGDSSVKQRVICSSYSDTGRNKVEIIAYDGPIYFGPQYIGIKIGEYGDTICTHIANDGVTVNENNFEILWEDEIAVVTVSGKNQLPVTYRIAFGSQGDCSIVRQVRHIERDGSSVLTKPEKGDDIPSNSEMSK